MFRMERKWMSIIISVICSGVLLLAFAESAASKKLTNLDKTSYKIIEITNTVDSDSESSESEEDFFGKQGSSIMASSEKNEVIPSSEEFSDKQALSQSDILPLLTKRNDSWPVVVNTWAFTEGTKSAWDVLHLGGSALDAVERGCSKCEELQCDGTVGYGGSPDENGETTLDAMIMDGETHAVGAVGCLRRVKNAIGVARKILDHTGHTLLVGELATNFALKMGFSEENLTTNHSQQIHEEWKGKSCQPNFWRNVTPDPTTSCGPYNAGGLSRENEIKSRPAIDRFNHDTISMVAIDSNGRIASGTSSNGARHKIPGRVGDAPITGAGSYVDKEVGGAGATGDGDIMARFLPSLIAVEEMRRGKTPEEAARYAISRITAYFPNFSGALVAVNLQGEIGAACHNIPNGFPYAYVKPSLFGIADVKVDFAACT